MPMAREAACDRTVGRSRVSWVMKYCEAGALLLRLEGRGNWPHSVGQRTKLSTDLDLGRHDRT